MQMQLVPEGWTIYTIADGDGRIEYMLMNQIKAKFVKIS